MKEREKLISEETEVMEIEFLCTFKERFNKEFSEEFEHLQNY
jgi:hypothetical protein